MIQHWQPAVKKWPPACKDCRYNKGTGDDVCSHPRAQRFSSATGPYQDYSSNVRKQGAPCGPSGALFEPAGKRSLWRRICNVFNSGTGGF